MGIIAASGTDVGLACATWVLAIFTAVMAGATFCLAVESRAASKRQIAVQTWLEFEQRFDSKEIKRARKMLADRMPYDATKHDHIREDLLDLFESIGIAYNEGF